MTAGGAPPASTRCATQRRCRPCASCGPPATASPAAATSRPDGSCPTSAIINAATADPKTVEELTALPVFGGSKQRKSAKVWLDALNRARESTDPPEANDTQSGPPPAARWARRKPEAAARLEAARAGLAELSERVSVPAENLITPEVVRRLCWDWRPVGDVATAVSEFLVEANVRPWQRELTVPVLTAALSAD